MSLLPRALTLLRAPSRRLPALLTARANSASTSEAPTPPSQPESSSPKAAADAPAFDMENPFLPERRQCVACRHRVTFDYKNVKLLSQFVSPFTGRMYGQHVTGLCKEQHRRLDSEYKKAVACGYVGMLLKQMEFLRDPKICDPTNPVRPHRF